MDQIFENNVLEFSTSEGTGPLTLQALPGYRRFSEVRTVGKTAQYMLKEVDVVGRPTGLYEYGIGTYSAANTFTRTTVLGSSTGAVVNLQPGGKVLMLTMLAPDADPIRFDYQDALGLNLAGAVQHFAMTAAPPGWLKCNGAAISRTAYARLFAKIGGTFGLGDGSTTFNLPDLRGEFIRGWDDGRTLDSGRGFASVQGSQNLSHQHGIYDPAHAHGIGDPGHAHGAYTDAQGYHDHATGTTPTGTVGPGGYGLAPGPAGFSDRVHVTGAHSGFRTDAQGTHAHNVGIYGAGTGVFVYASGTGIQVYPDGGTEARPRNVALLTCIKY